MTPDVGSSQLLEIALWALWVTAVLCSQKHKSTKDPGMSSLTGLTKNGHVPKGTCGLMDIQHPAVLDDHPVVSAQSQLSTCGGARP